MPNVLHAEDNPSVQTLRGRLDEFYRTTTVYDAFKGVNTSPMFWAPVLDEIRAKAARPDAKVRVLEFGAGRSGFGDALGELRPKVELHMQDVTPANADFLATQGQHVHIGDLLELRGPYDVIFSTFVWEHLSNPRQTLQHLLSLLTPGGSLYIASPRYDLPIYVPPSARHYGIIGRLSVMGRLIGARAATAMGGRPAFLVHTDPSLFHRPWYRDADAIHWPSIHDLRRAIPSGYSMQRLAVKSGGGVKGVLWSRFLLLFVRITRDASSR